MQFNYNHVSAERATSLLYFKNGYDDMFRPSVSECFQVRSLYTKSSEKKRLHATASITKRSSILTFLCNCQYRPILRKT